MIGITRSVHFMGNPGPSAFGTVAAWWDLGDTPEEVSYDDGTGERLTNGDLEAGDWTGWSVGNSATLTAETASPYEGTYWGKIAFNGASNPYANQAAAVTGATYYATGVGAGDGSVDGRLHIGGTNLWDSSGTAWQPWAFVTVAASTAVRMFALTSGAGYSKWDALSLTECPHATKYLNLNSPGTDDLVQATPGNAGTTGPNWGGAGGLTAGRTNGSTHYWTADGLASVFSGDDKAWTIGIAFQCLDDATFMEFLNVGNSSDNTKYLRLNSDGSGGLKIRKFDGTTVKTQTIDASFDENLHVLVFKSDGTTVDVWYDGVQVLNGADFDVAAVTLDQFTVAAARGTATRDHAAAVIKEIVVFSEDIGDVNAPLFSAWMLVRSPIS